MRNICYNNLHQIQKAVKQMLEVQSHNATYEISDASPIVIYYYYDLSDTAYFCRTLQQRFRETGHTRPLKLIEWNCYKGPPGIDGDIFIYDAVAMSALVDQGYLQRIPNIIDLGDVFNWVIEKGKVRQKTYGIPLMLCANALICRRKDDRQISNVMELNESVAIPMRTMLMYYYLQSFCNYQDSSNRYFQVMQHLTKLMGGKAFLEQSTLKEYNGIERFIRGECKYFLGFTENLRLFEPDDYVVRFANFSDHGEDQMPLFMVDFVSLGRNVREEKLLDCLDLLEIMADKAFVYDLCTAEGQLQYMLPASKSIYPELAKIDPIYNQLFDMLLPEENGVFRYGIRFYEDFYQRSGAIFTHLLL